MIDAIGILQDSTSRTLSRGVSDVSYNVLNLPQRPKKKRAKAGAPVWV